MIEKISIKNFQNQATRRFNLDPHVTTIVGPSDAGKSAILRAIGWLLTNRPAGEEFVRHGLRTTTVRAIIDGHVATRRRRMGGENVYKLDNARFASLRRDVPEPLANLFNVDEVNFQWQHDLPYWFSCTPSEVARRLNAIVNLDIIDKALGHLASETRHAKTAAAVAGERYRDARKLSRELLYVDDLADDFATLKEAHTAHTTANAQAARCAAVVANARQAKAAAKRAAAAAQGGQVLVAAYARAATAQEAADRLRASIATATTAAGAYTPPPSTENIEDAFNKAREAANRAGLLLCLLRSVRTARAHHQEKAAAVSRLRGELSKIGVVVCPTCKRPLDRLP